MDLDRVINQKEVDWGLEKEPMVWPKKEMNPTEDFNVRVNATEMGT